MVDPRQSYSLRYFTKSRYLILVLIAVVSDKLRALRRLATLFSGTVLVRNENGAMILTRDYPAIYLPTT
jgi:hypothetical protein